MRTPGWTPFATSFAVPSPPIPTTAPDSISRELEPMTGPLGLVHLELADALELGHDSVEHRPADAGRRRIHDQADAHLTATITAGGRPFPAHVRHGRGPAGRLVILGHLAWAWNAHPASADRRSAAFDHGLAVAAILAATLVAGRVALWMEGQARYLWADAIAVLGRSRSWGTWPSHGGTRAWETSAWRSSRRRAGRPGGRGQPDPGLRGTAAGPLTAFNSRSRPMPRAYY
jgi:hypothetical protein